MNQDLLPLLGLQLPELLKKFTIANNFASAFAGTGEKNLYNSDYIDKVKNKYGACSMAFESLPREIKNKIKNFKERPNSGSDPDSDDYWETYYWENLLGGGPRTRFFAKCNF